MALAAAAKNNEMKSAMLKNESARWHRREKHQLMAKINKIAKNAQAWRGSIARVRQR